MDTKPNGLITPATAVTITEPRAAQATQAEWDEAVAENANRFIAWSKPASDRQLAIMRMELALDREARNRRAHRPRRCASRAVSAPVDVLAVMAAAHDGRLTTANHEMWQARAAVAELIEAAQAVAVHQDAAISAEWGRLDAALARVKGVQS